MQRIFAKSYDRRHKSRKMQTINLIRSIVYALFQVFFIHRFHILCYTLLKIREQWNSVAES